MTDVSTGRTEQFEYMLARLVVDDLGSPEATHRLEMLTEARAEGGRSVQGLTGKLSVTDTNYDQFNELGFGWAGNVRWPEGWRMVQHQLVSWGADNVRLGFPWGYNSRPSADYYRLSDTVGVYVRKPQ